MTHSWRHNFAAIFVGAICFARLADAQSNRPSSELEEARATYAKARSELDDASSAVSRAEVAKMRLEKSIRVEYQTKPDLAEAKSFAAATSRHYNALRHAVLKELETDSDYAQLIDGQRAAENVLRTLQADDKSTLEQKLISLHNLLAIRAEVTRFQSAALALDPAVDDARQAVSEAHEQSNKLDRFYQSQAVNDSRLDAARDEITHAKERAGKADDVLADARQKLIDAEKREAMRNAGRRADRPPINRPEP